MSNYLFIHYVIDFFWYVKIHFYQYLFWCSKMFQIWPAPSNCFLTPFEMSLYSSIYLLIFSLSWPCGLPPGLYVSNRTVIWDKPMALSGHHSMLHRLTTPAKAFPSRQLSCTICGVKKNEMFPLKDAWNSDHFKLLRSNL